MADQLTEEQIAEFKEAFSLFDKDGDGVISLDNFKSVLSFFKDEVDGDDEVDDYILENIIKQVDSDGDGKISYQDFQEMMFHSVAETEGPPALGPAPMVTDAPTTDAPKKKSRHVRRTSVVDVKGAGSCMAVFADAVAADPQKRHRRNHSHFSHFANLAGMGGDVPQQKKPSHKKDNKSMSFLPLVEEERPRSADA
jgi:hypothetical protein